MPRINVGQVSMGRLIGSAQGDATATTLTIAVVIPASMAFLHIGISSQDSNDAVLPITGVTVNGSSSGVVKAIETLGNPNDTVSSVWYKLSPDAGSYNVVISTSGSTYKAAVVSWWSGVIAQAPEATAGSSGTAASVALPITALSNYAVVIDTASHKGAYSSISNGQTLVGTEAGQSFEHVTVTYKEVNAGATTMGQQWGSSNSFSDSAIALAPTVNIIQRTVATIGSRTVATIGSRTIAT